ncbi:MAG: ADP-ribosylglycohydrolase family protein [Prosthecobacter sp.]|uniref:ADP-ribosylglycohydrolase family protein n=1 Tax=Prosthecobacter sp. TaxID=1965333 RepID=UPI0025FC97C7|nr:ADP-ribosylglycohydrolase family protein [Prosthecobacter sp.]MCF7785377.1 ADP-ribosylglycohydrolase family protein [Prosthecobacter sp.]
MTQEKHILGGLYGSLVGDALGVPVEFASREKRKLDPVIGMRGHGTHGQPAGTWSDDGSLLLCSAESLVEKGFDLQDMGERFLQWFELGHWAAHGLVFDIGNATRQSLLRIRHGIPAIEAGGREPYDNGNGSLMRILPVALANLHQDEITFISRIAQASAITHGHVRSQMACVFHGLVVRELMQEATPQTALQKAQQIFQQLYSDNEELGTFRDLLRPDLASQPEIHIHSGGYVMETLTASLWCLLTTDNFSDCVLKTVNLGDDTDTTGCVAGGLAGVVYGLDAIPAEWRLALPRQKDLRELFAKFERSLSLW